MGFAIAHTPVLNQPLEGPAYLVSHGNRAFPDLEIVLQGEGVKVVLDGLTDIKKGITKTTFESVPDSPVESFELNLPEGPNSILAAPENLCTPTREATVKQSVAVRRKGHVVHVMKTVTKRVPEKLIMPTQLIGQNGAVIKQNTVIGVTGCPPTVAISKVQRKGNAAAGDREDERRRHRADQRQRLADDHQEARGRQPHDSRRTDGEGPLAGC